MTSTGTTAASAAAATQASKVSPLQLHRLQVAALWDGPSSRLRVPITHQPEPAAAAKGGIAQWTWGPSRTAKAPTCSGSAIELQACLLRHCPFGAAGDLLWLRETYWTNGRPDADPQCVVVYDATPEVLLRPGQPCKPVTERDAIYPVVGDRDQNRRHLDRAGWRRHSATTMPRWCSRFTLELTALRVERLHDAIPEELAGDLLCVQHGAPARLLRERYAAAWESVYGPWTRNDWVWLLDYTSFRENVDFHLARQAA